MGLGLRCAAGRELKVAQHVREQREYLVGVGVRARVRVRVWVEVRANPNPNPNPNPNQKREHLCLRQAVADTHAGAQPERLEMD